MTQSVMDEPASTEMVPACIVVESFSPEYPVGTVILKPQFAYMTTPGERSPFCPLDEDTGKAKCVANVEGIGYIEVDHVPA